MSSDELYSRTALIQSPCAGKLGSYLIKLCATKIEIFLFMLRFVICELDFMQSCIAKSLLIAVIILVNLHNGHLTSRKTAKQSHF